MSAPNQGGIDESEIIEAAIEATSSVDVSTSQVISRKIVPGPSVPNSAQLTTSQATPPTSGRQVMPVVYFNLPRSRVATSGSPTAVTVVNPNNQSGGILLNNVAQALPPGARGVSFLPGLSQKITVNSTSNSVSNAALGSTANQQPTFVTIRSAGQPGMTNSSGTSQPHFVTIPKDSLPKSSQSHQQFVTMVPKSSLATTSGSGGQIVTIRAPIIAGAGGVSQNQILTIQAPVLQQGTNQATLVPISGANSSGKPHISYISPVLKNGAVPKLVASAPKMVLSTVPTLQKSSHTFSPVSQSSSGAPVNSVPVTNIVTLSRSGGTPTITIVPPKPHTATSTVTIVPPKDATSKQPSITVHPGKEQGSISTVTFVPPKDPTAQPTFTLLPGKETSANQSVTIVSSKDSVTGKSSITFVPQKEPAATLVTGKDTVLSSKDAASRITGINPLSLLSSKDISSAGSAVTLLSSKDVPPGGPITLISKDSPSFAILSKEAKLVSPTDTITIMSSKDTATTNPFTIFTSQEDADTSVTLVKDTPQNPAPCPSKNIPDSSGIPTFSFVSSKDGNPGNPTVTLLPSKDSTSPTYAILPARKEGPSNVTVLPSKDSISNPTITILSSKDGGNPTVTVVPSKDVTESVSTAPEPAHVPSRLTTLPFSLSPEMTVTTTEVPTITYPQFQQIGKDISTTASGPVQGFISLQALIESQKSIEGVSLPESTTLTPISETDLAAPKNELSITEESIILKKEVVEILNDPQPKPAKRNSLLISNNLSIPKTIETEAGSSDELSKSLQDAVAALCTSKDVVQSENIQQTAVITCKDDDDEVTLIKLTPSFEQSNDTFAAFDDNPDDIKIELIKCTEVLESSKESDTDVDDVTINVEKELPSLVPSMPPLVSSVKTTKNDFLPKSLSNIRSPSILKNHIANKGRKFDHKLLSPLQYRPQKDVTVKRADSFPPAKSGTPLPKVEPKKEIKKEPDSTATPEDFDPIKALEWKNGVGLLPGSNLKFRINEFGFIEMISDDDKEQDGRKSPQPLSQISDDVDGSTGSGDEKDTKPDKRKLDTYYEDEDDDEDKVYDPEDIVRCKHCGVYGMAAEFVNQRYCNTSCQEGAALKKAAEFKREQEHRALKLRRKRRRLERISERGSVEVKKEDNSDDQMEIDDPGQSLSKDNSLNPTPIPSDDDAMSFTSADGVETTKGKGGKAKPATQFTWVKYLQSIQAKGAPAKLFKDDGTYTKNKFKVAFKLEGIDPEHPAHFCVLSVAEVKGCRLRLHFDGYSESHDFWVNCDSPEIFPVGWCQKNNRRLDPPRGFTSSSFNWTTYLKSCRAFAAPRHFFAKGTTNAVCPNGFRIGMKLEAVDRKDSSLICVATVADILDNRILVHFDSWDDMYDYWVDPSSPYIHPVGWCAENKRVLTPPNEFKDPSLFSWSAYLKQTKSIPAPARAFKQRPPVGFKPGMRLEAVDKRAPQCIRVATVQEVENHRILLHFDGWSRIYDYWVDEDCPDIHRPGWCRDTKHPLEAPLKELKDSTHCVTPGCRGEGHIKGAKFSSHVTVQNCPYSPENMEKEGLIPDRLNPKGDLEYLEIPTPEKGLSLNNTLRIVEGRRPLGRPRKWKRHLEVFSQSKKRRVSGDDDRDKRSVSPLETASKLQLELHQSVFEPGYRVDVGLNRSACWAKHSLPLHSSPMLTDDTDPHTWNPSDVLKFVSTVTGLEDQAEKFREEEIDGEALLLMTQQDLVDNIGLKLGPAIKLYNCIVLLRQRAL